ncbi:hypothetical protein PMIN04_011770 [Paraphaeosphaeria minitans]
MRRKVVNRPAGYYEKLRDQLAEQGPTEIPYSDTTNLNLSGTWKKWTRYSKYRATKNPIDLLKSATVADYKTFFNWTLDHHPGVRKKSSLHQYWRQLKMHYKCHTKRRLHQDIVDDVNKHIQALTEEYRLDKSPPKRPVLDIDGLLVLLFYNMVQCTNVYKEEEQRLLLDLLLVWGAYTGARPVSLVGTSVSIPSKEAVAKVRDDAIRFYDSGDKDEGEDEADDDTCMEDSRPSDYDVPEAECLKSILFEHVTIVTVRVEGQVKVGMYLTLIHTKGEGRKPQPKTFKMYQNKNPLLCPITRMIAVGLHRNAFAASSIRSAEAILRARIPRRKTCRIFRWKETMLKEPVFREPTRNKDRAMSKGLAEPLRPQTAARYLKRLGRDVGLEQSLTQSCIRRGTGNAVDSAGTVGERDQVMGHSHSGIFQFYINPNVKCDVRAAFLDEPSDDVLVKMLGNMSLTRDPLAPTRLGLEDARTIEEHPTVARLRQRRDALTDTLKRLRQGSERCVDEEEKVEKLVDLRKGAEAALRRKKKQLRDRMLKKARERYFMENDTRELEEEDDKLLEDEAETKTRIVYALEERARIADLLCSPVVDLDEPGALDRRIELIRVMKELCGRREVRRRGIAANPAQAEKKEEEVAFAPPLECDARQCLFCVGDESMPVSQRMFCYSRPAKMMDHIEKDHLDQFEADAEIPCPHPTCRKDQVVLNSVSCFKAHAQGIHKIKLRLPKATAS